MRPTGNAGVTTSRISCHIGDWSEFKLDLVFFLICFNIHWTIFFAQIYLHNFLHHFLIILCLFFACCATYFFVHSSYLYGCLVENTLISGQIILNKVSLMVIHR